MEKVDFICNVKMSEVRTSIKLDQIDKRIDTGIKIREGNTLVVLHQNRQRSLENRYSLARSGTEPNKSVEFFTIKSNLHFEP